MFDVAPQELMLVAFVALVVIGPKDLPKALRLIGKWVGRARGVARHFRTGLDSMIRESELAEMEKQWKAENERIMREFPVNPMLPPPPPMALPPSEALDFSEDPEPVMVEHPVIRPEPEPEPAPKPRRRKPPSTGDLLEAPKPRKPRAPRAKAQS